MKRIKGSPRPAKTLERRLRWMASKIPDRETFEAFLGRYPEHQRAEVRALLAPHTNFKPRNSQ